MLSLRSHPVLGGHVDPHCSDALLLSTGRILKAVGLGLSRKIKGGKAAGYTMRPGDMVALLRVFGRLRHMRPSHQAADTTHLYDNEVPLQALTDLVHEVERCLCAWSPGQLLALSSTIGLFRSPPHHEDSRRSDEILNALANALEVELSRRSSRETFMDDEEGDEVLDQQFVVAGDVAASAISGMHVCGASV